MIGMRPKNNVEPNFAMGFVDDDRYAFEPKYDGHRLMIHIGSTGVNINNRNGEVSQHQGKLSTHPNLQSILSFSMNTSASLFFDVEYVNGDFIIFDCVIGGICDLGDMFSIRRKTLQHFYQISLSHMQNIFISDIALDRESKMQMMLDVHDRDGEGIVIKDLDAPYFGGATDAVVKCKFYRTVDAFVTGIHPTKESVEISVYDGHQAVKIGHCSTVHSPQIAIGDVLEVRYRRVSDHNRIIEPVLQRVRSDKSPQECLFTQIGKSHAKVYQT